MGILDGGGREFFWFFGELWFFCFCWCWEGKGEKKRGVLFCWVFCWVRWVFVFLVRDFFLRKGEEVVLFWGWVVFVFVFVFLVRELCLAFALSYERKKNFTFIGFSSLLCPFPLSFPFLNLHQGHLSSDACV